VKNRQEKRTHFFGRRGDDDLTAWATIAMIIVASSLLVFGWILATQLAR
jgi:hypothetical protein